MKIGDKVLIKAEVSEIRHNGTIIVKAASGDYFGVGASAVIPDGSAENESENDPEYGNQFLEF